MDGEHQPAASHRISRLANKMRDRKVYRDSYVSSMTRQFLARQMREFRGLSSQVEFGVKIDKQQTIVSRLEDPNYGRWTLQTMFEVASKLNVAVLVRFVDFTTFFRVTNDRSRDALLPQPYDQQKIDNLAYEMETDFSQASVAFYNEAQRSNNASTVSFGSAEQAAALTPAANENVGTNRAKFRAFTADAALTETA